MISLKKSINKHLIRSLITMNNPNGNESIVQAILTLRQELRGVDLRW